MELRKDYTEFQPIIMNTKATVVWQMITNQYISN
jgi:hypothetical protein